MLLATVPEASTRGWEAVPLSLPLLEPRRGHFLLEREHGKLPGWLAITRGILVQRPVDPLDQLWSTSSHHEMRKWRLASLTG